MYENEGANDSNMDIESGPLTVGLHPERDPDAVFITIGEASGQITSSSWLGDVVAVVASHFDDHSEAADVLIKACSAKLTEDETDAVTVALQALRGRGEAQAEVRWHWGKRRIDAKATISTRELCEAAKLSEMKCGAKVAAVLGAKVLPVPGRTMLPKLGRQVRFLVG